MSYNINNLSEGDVPIGTWNKYTSKNPIQRLLVKLFFDSIKKSVMEIKDFVNTSLDVGCGEGRITQLLHEIGLGNISGCDFSEIILNRARGENPRAFFYKRNIYDLNKDESADLITVCEVLEHLEKPDIALKRLSYITNKYCIFSVPEEPLFRILNFLAGKYWKDYGNPPGHINHWSKREFIKLIERHFKIIECKRSIPWIIVIASPR